MAQSCKGEETWENENCVNLVIWGKKTMLSKPRPKYAGGKKKPARSWVPQWFSNGFSDLAVGSTTVLVNNGFAALVLFDKCSHNGMKPR